MKKYFIIGLLVIVTGCGAFYGCQKTYLTNIVPDVADSSGAINICSFNIQFLGHFKKKDNHALTDILKDYDIIVVQEMVAPPVDGTYP